MQEENFLANELIGSNYHRRKSTNMTFGTSANRQSE